MYFFFLWWRPGQSLRLGSDTDGSKLCKNGMRRELRWHGWDVKRDNRTRHGETALEEGKYWAAYGQHLCLNRPWHLFAPVMRSAALLPKSCMPQWCLGFNGWALGNANPFAPLSGDAFTNTHVNSVQPMLDKLQIMHKVKYATYDRYTLNQDPKFKLTYKTWAQQSRM